MNICVAGKNNIAVEILFYLLKYGVPKKKIFVIPNDTDNGKDNWQRSLLKNSRETGIEVTTLEKVRLIDDLLFISLEFDKIINPDKFKSNKLFNIHFSLLPKYRGVFTSTTVILNNEKTTGVTFHKIDKGIDTGDIIGQKSFKIELTDNARDIYHKYIKNGILLTKFYLDKILKNEFIKTKPQSLKNSLYFSRQYINFKNTDIDMCETALNIHNRIRAFNFREFQLPKVFDQEVISSKILDSKSSKKAGTILFENYIYFKVSTIDNDIIIYKDRSKDFFLACQNDTRESFTQLIEIPKIINIQNKNGLTPLMVAIYYNKKEFVEILLDKGANLNISDFKGMTPLMYAKNTYLKFKDPDMLKLLLKLDTNIYKQDYSNKNVLDYCIENNEIEALNIIKQNKK